MERAEIEGLLDANSQALDLLRLFSATTRAQYEETPWFAGCGKLSRALAE
jgi:hypothetical protein